MIRKIEMQKKKREQGTHSDLIQVWIKIQWSKTFEEAHPQVFFACVRQYIGSYLDGLYG